MRIQVTCNSPDFQVYYLSCFSFFLYLLLYFDEDKNAINIDFYLFVIGAAINPMINDSEDPHPSLSDWHDYEPNLEFDDTELSQTQNDSGFSLFCFIFIYLFTPHLNNLFL